MFKPFQFHTFQIQPGFPDGEAPDVPGLSEITVHKEYAELQQQLKAVFREQLAKGDGERLENDDGQVMEGFFNMQFAVAGMGGFLVLGQFIRQTACLAHLFERLEDGSQGPLLGVWILLSGFNDADETLIDLLGQPDANAAGEALFTEAQQTAARGMPKPLVYQWIDPALYEPQPRLLLFLLACEAFGQAFFDQFGASRANELEGEDEGDRG